MKYYIIIITCILSGCFSVSDSEISDSGIGTPENYLLTEKNISNDCRAYQIRYHKGDNMFRFSLSGTCKDLSMSDYLDEYSKFLQSYKDSLIVKRGYIIFDYYNFSDTSNVFVDSLLKITRQNFKTNVGLLEVGENSFTLKVFDKD